MALKGPYYIEDIALDVADAYINIALLEGSKDYVKILLNVYLNKEARLIGKNPIKQLPKTVLEKEAIESIFLAEGLNIYQAVYTYLIDLPEFSEMVSDVD